MKINFARYKEAIKIAQQTNPGRSYTGILSEKIVKKLRHNYDLIRCFILKDSTFMEADSLYMCSLFPVKTIDRVIEEFHPQTILDVGCGTGVSLEYFLQKNINATGI
jgi:ubiquinone/menaquinone biosynthesis C-methylase UbiE